MATMNIHKVHDVTVSDDWIAEPGDRDYPKGLLVQRITIVGNEGEFKITLFPNDADSVPIPLAVNLDERARSNR